MKTHCVMQGQSEIGVIEHEGREYAAFGASVEGRHVTAYTKVQNGNLRLRRWCGQTMLASRWEIVEGYRDGALALMFRLTHGRFIIGYALGDDGMLFRGELFVGRDDEARRMARRLAHRFAELDAEDEFRWEDDA
ncbi:MAG TPA: hypothetical protein PKC45_09700 [Gemmatales bacterium]|nr:hypothetical protein [Gemmatales bacterium]